MKPIRVAQIGIGYWGPNVARSLVSTGRADLRWLCDLNADVLAKVAANYPQTRTTADMQDILGDPEVEAVVICTPSVTHHGLARTALEAGKHVLVEKPMTITSAEAEDLVRIAGERKRILMVGHVFQYNLGLRALKTLIDSGELGEIYYMDFERTNLGPVRTDVNALWDLASHDISIVCDLMGRPPDHVSATGKVSLNAGIEDVVFATLSYNGGPYAHIHASWLNPRKVRRLNVIGSKKMAIWDDLDLKAPLQVVDKRVENPAPGHGRDTFLDYKTLCVDGGTYIPEIRLAPPLQEECDHFLRCVAEGSTPRTDGRNGADVVRVLEAATASLRREGVKVPCDRAGLRSFIGA
jgi:predicted dehydrogenase